MLEEIRKQVADGRLDVESIVETVRNELEDEFGDIKAWATDNPWKAVAIGALGGLALSSLLPRDKIPSIKAQVTDAVQSTFSSEHEALKAAMQSGGAAMSSLGASTSSVKAGLSSFVSRLLVTAADAIENSSLTNRK